MDNPIYHKIKEIVEGFSTVSVTTQVIDGAERLIKTDMNVITGDTTFQIHKDFVADETKLNEFHQQQVLASKETLQATMEALATLAEKVGDKLGTYLEGGGT